MVRPGGAARPGRGPRGRDVGVHGSRAALHTRERGPPRGHLLHRGRMLRDVDRGGSLRRVPAAVGAVGGRSAFRPHRAAPPPAPPGEALSTKARPEPRRGPVAPPPRITPPPP